MFLNIAVLLILIVPYFALSVSGVRENIVKMRVNPVVFGGYIFLAFFLAVFEMILNGDKFAFASGTLKIVGYIFIPISLQIVNKHIAKRNIYLDCLTILTIWIPYELKLLPDIKIFGVFIPLLIGMLNAIFIYLVINPWMPDVGGAGTPGYSFKFHKKDIYISLRMSIILIAVLIPLGVITKFLVPSHMNFGIVKIFQMFLTIYFFIALPQELIFRGVIQNIIERYFGKTTVSIVTASVIFGVSHLNNVTFGFGVPNIPFVIFSTIAGIGYGIVWKKTGKITVAAITHAIINLIWETLFLF